MTEIRDLPALDVTQEGFAPFGSVIFPAEDGTPFGAADAVLHLTGGTPRFYAMRLQSRGLVISRITRHRAVTQVLASAGGLPWLLAVAPPPEVDAVDAAPAVEAIRAFRIPGDVAVMLKRGAWHAGPLFETPEASFFNLELSDTNVTDHWNCDLSARFGVSLRVVPAAPALLAELQESEATGRIAEIYDEVRRFSGVPYVSSLQRYLATMPGVLEWAWDALRPAMVSGAIPQTAWRLAEAVRLVSAGRCGIVVPARDVLEIRNIAANFVRVSPVNLMMGACLRLLLSGVRPTGSGFGKDWEPVAMLPPMPGNVDPLALAADQQALLMRFATEMNGKPFVPALYRQIAHWPAVLAWLADVLEPLFAAPLVLETGAAFRAAAGEAAGPIVDRLPPLPGRAPLDAETTRQVLGAIDRYAQTSPEMTMFGQVILDALPAPALSREG